MPLTVQEEEAQDRDNSSIHDPETDTISSQSSEGSPATPATPEDEMESPCTPNPNDPEADTVNHEATGITQITVISPSQSSPVTESPSMHEMELTDVMSDGRQRDSHIMCVTVSHDRSPRDRSPRRTSDVLFKEKNGRPSQSVLSAMSSMRSEISSNKRKRATSTKQGKDHYEGHFMLLNYMPFDLIPQSAIIEEYGNDIEKMFLQIYDKYIDWKHSSFEINISHSVRQKMHDIYVRITYQMLLDERKQILREERVARESGMAPSNMNGTDGVDSDNGMDPERTSGLWHSRKSVVNTLKATISQKQLGGFEDNVSTESGTKGRDNAKQEEEKMNTVVENEEMIEALTLAEHDILRNLNDSLTRFRRTPELQHLLVENGELFIRD